MYACIQILFKMFYLLYIAIYFVFMLYISHIYREDLDAEKDLKLRCCKSFSTFKFHWKTSVQVYSTIAGNINNYYNNDNNNNTKTIKYAINNTHHSDYKIHY